MWLPTAGLSLHRLLRQQNILAGTGNGTFNPEGELTGLAFAKMLLVALAMIRYRAVCGNDWAVNVAADAVDAGIAVSGVIMADAMTREQAAQMAYQTLEPTWCATPAAAPLSSSLTAPPSSWATLPLNLSPRPTATMPATATTIPSSSVSVTSQI